MLKTQVTQLHLASIELERDFQSRFEIFEQEMKKSAGSSEAVKEKLYREMNEKYEERLSSFQEQMAKHEEESAKILESFKAELSEASSRIKKDAEDEMKGLEAKLNSDLRAKTAMIKRLLNENLLLKQSLQKQRRHADSEAQKSRGLAEKNEDLSLLLEKIRSQHEKQQNLLRQQQLHIFSLQNQSQQPGADCGTTESFPRDAKDPPKKTGEQSAVLENASPDEGSARDQGEDALDRREENEGNGESMEEEKIEGNGESMGEEDEEEEEEEEEDRGRRSEKEEKEQIEEINRNDLDPDGEVVFNEDDEVDASRIFGSYGMSSSSAFGDRSIPPELPPLPSSSSDRLNKFQL